MNVNSQYLQKVIAQEKKLEDLYALFDIQMNEVENAQLKVDDFLFIGLRKFDALLALWEEINAQESSDGGNSFVNFEKQHFRALVQEKLGEIEVHMLKNAIHYFVGNIFQTPSDSGEIPQLQNLHSGYYTDYFAYKTYQKQKKKLQQEKNMRLSKFTEKYSHKPELQTLALQYDPILMKVDDQLKDINMYIDALEESPLVRITETYMDHVHAVETIQDKRSQIIEFSEMKPLLEKCDVLLYGDQHAKKVAGVMLSGPPGVGKSTILNYYFQHYYGVRPLVVDITRFDNKFTLVASESLKSNDRLGKIAHIREVYEGLTSELQIEFQKRIQCPSSEKLEEIFAEREVDLLAREMQELQSTQGYKLHIVTQGLLENRPVIFDEFINLNDWSFLNGLLEAEPCTDEERAPHPKNVLQGEGEQNFPRGWWFNNITHQWMKVPEKFRICFTGNIGQEYGNQGMQRALASRFENRMLAVPPIDPKMQVKLLWSYISNRFGEVVVSSELAHRLYTLVHDVFPLIEKKLKDIKANMKPFSARTIISMGQQIYNAATNKIIQSMSELDQILWDTLLEPCVANNYLEQGRIIIQNLTAAQFLLSHDVMIKVNRHFRNGEQTMGVELGLDKIEGEKCPICGVKACFLHVDLYESARNLNYENLLTTKILKSSLVRERLGKVLLEKTDLSTLVEKLYWITKYTEQSATKFIHLPTVIQAFTKMVESKKMRDEFDVLQQSKDFQTLCLQLFIIMRRSSLQQSAVELSEERMCGLLQKYAPENFEEHEYVLEAESFLSRDSKEEEKEILKISDHPVETAELLLKHWDQRLQIMKSMKNSSLSHVLTVFSEVDKILRTDRSSQRKIERITNMYAPSQNSHEALKKIKEQEKVELKKLGKEIQNLLPSSVDDMSVEQVLLLTEYAGIQKDMKELPLIYFQQLRHMVEELTTSLDLLKKAHVLTSYYVKQYGTFA